jgi:hypothetical protein
MLGLGNTITGEKSHVWATQFANFNGTDAKALAEPGRLPSVLAGSGTIGDNVTFSMWIKATWNIPVSPADAVVNNIPIFMLGSDTDVHEGFRMYYMIEDGSANNKNDIVIELRSSNPSNTRQNEIMRLSATGLPNNSVITGSDSSAHDDMWDNDNTKIKDNAEGFVHIVCSRTTGDWSVFWNSQECEVIENDSGSLNQDVSEYDSFSIGYWQYSDSFGQLGVRDFAVYNSQLSSSDVTALYNDGKLEDHRNLITPQPIVYYPFQEDGNDIITSTGPNLTLSNVTFESI